MSSICPYQKVLDSHKTYSSTLKQNPQYITVQRAFFNALSELYSYWNPGQSVPQLSKGSYYEQAVRIQKQKALQNHPTLLNQVKPSADSYYKAFNNVISFLKNPKSEDSFKNELSQLVLAHTSFIQSYFPVYQITHPDSSAVIFQEFQQTISLFLKAITPHLNELKQQIENNDPSFFLLIPRLAIEELLKAEDDLIPELFITQKNQIEEIRKSYSLLSDDDKESLHKKITGQPVDLSNSAKELFMGICAFSIPKDGKSKIEMNRIFKFIYEELTKIFIIQKSLPKVRITDRAMAGQYLVYGFVLNPDLTKESLPLVFKREKYWNPILLLREELKPFQIKESLDGQVNEEKSDSERLNSRVLQIAQFIANDLKANPWLGLFSTNGII